MSDTCFWTLVNTIQEKGQWADIQLWINIFSLCLVLRGIFWYTKRLSVRIWYFRTELKSFLPFVLLQILNWCWGWLLSDEFAYLFADQFCLIFDLKVGQWPEWKNVKGLWLTVHVILFTFLPVNLSVKCWSDWCHYLIDYPLLLRRPFSWVSF